MDFGDITGSSGFQIAYPLLNMLLAGSSPRGAAAAQGLNLGLGVANRYSEQNKADAQSKLLGQSLQSVLKSTTPVSSTQSVASMPVNPATASFEMPGVKEQTIDDINPSQKLGDALAPVPLEKQTTVTQKPAFSPQVQQLGDALVNAHKPDLLLPMLTRELMRDPKLTSVRPGGSLVDEQGNVKYQAPAPPVREATPPRPVVGTQGGEGVTSVYNPQTKQWEIQRTPLTAAPARQLSPEAAALEAAKLRTEQQRPGLIGAQTGAARSESALREGRLSQLKEAAKIAKDPNSTLGQLASWGGHLERTLNSYETPEEDKPAIIAQMKALRERGNQMTQQRAPGGGAQPAAAAPPPAAAPKQLDRSTAAQILKEAGGDKNKARALAKQRGFQF